MWEWGFHGQVKFAGIDEQNKYPLAQELFVIDDFEKRNL